MQLPAVRDWQKVRGFLDGTWPLPDPKYLETTYAVDSGVWFAGARHAPFIAIDTEFNASTGYLYLIGIGYPGGKTVLSFKHRESAWTDRHGFAIQLRELVKQVPVVFQNAIADIPVIEKAYGITYSDYHSIDDTMLGHAVLWSDWPHTLEFLASIYGRHNKMKHLAESNMALYNTGDVVDTVSAWEGIDREFKGDVLSHNVYTKQSLPLIPIILRAQARGLRVNKGRVESALRDLVLEKEWARDIAQAYCGWPINIGSDDQLKYHLFNQEQLPVQYKPKTENITIDGDAIAALRGFVGPFFDAEEESKFGLSIHNAVARIKDGAHPVLEARVVYAAAQQALSHYVLPMCEVDKEGGLRGIRDIVYPRFLAHAQASGRWSTVDPPMAQIPKPLQDLVIPHEGEKWIEWDWDQIELRILAALSKDEVYVEAFKRGWDIHTLNTCDVFGWPYPEDKSNPHTSTVDRGWREARNWGGKDDPRRRFAKVFIFRLNYGGEAKTATDIPGVKQLGLDSKALVAGSQSYIKKHPRIRDYWNAITANGIERREIRTFMGRRRRLLVEGKNAMKRLIYNHPMQGGVSDVFNTTLVRMAERLPQACFAYGVHDAQKWSVKVEDYESAYQTAYDIVHTPWDIGGEKIVFPATFKKG